MAPIVVPSAVLLLGVALMFWQGRRDRGIVRQWAEREGWTLLDVRPARMHEHPDFLKFRLTQGPAYRVRVTRSDGGYRTGAVVLGRGLALTTLEHTRVWWDDAGAAAGRGFPVIPLGDRRA